MIALVETPVYSRPNHREGWDPRTSEPCVCPDCGGKLVRSFEHNDKEMGKTTVFEFECKLTFEPGTPAPCAFACQATDEAREAYRLLVDGSASVVEVAPVSEVAVPEQVAIAEAPAENLPAVLELPELKEIENFRAELAEFMGAPIEATIKDAIKVTEGLTVAKHVKGPKAGRDAVHSALMNLVRVRTQILTPKKEKFKGPVNAIGRQVDARYRELVAWLAPHEARLEKERDDWDKAEQKRKDAEAEIARVAAQAKTQARLDALSARGIAPNLAQAQTLTDEAWEKWLELETEQASIRARAQDVADRLTALGDPCVYVEALALSEEEQRIRLEAAAHADLLRKDAEKLAKELTELGDPCTTEEALVLPAEAAVQRLRDAREDKKRLDEEARIALGQSRRDALLDEDPEILIDGRPLPTPDDLAALNPADWAEKLGNVKRAVEERGRRRLQLGADRMAVLAGLGMEGIPTQTQLCVLTDESFETIRALAADAKVTRDRLADEQRAEMDRLREVERLAKVALESTRRGILDSIWPGWWAEEESYGRVPLCDLDERRFQGCADRCRREKEQKNTQEREDVEREARARPEREKLAAWGREVMIAIPEVPEVKDPRNVAILSNATVGIQSAIRAMRDALGDVTGE